MTTASSGLSLKPTLLWTNTSVSGGSTFEAQTVSLSLSVYKMILVSYYPTTSYWNSNSTNSYYTKYIIKGINDNLNPGGDDSHFRPISVTDSGVVFGGAYYNAAGGGGSVLGNDLLIPKQIYGIK